MTVKDICAVIDKDITLRIYDDVRTPLGEYKVLAKCSKDEIKGSFEENLEVTKIMADYNELFLDVPYSRLSTMESQMETILSIFAV